MLPEILFKSSVASQNLLIQTHWPAGSKLSNPAASRIVTHVQYCSRRRQRTILCRLFHDANEHDARYIPVTLSELIWCCLIYFARIAEFHCRFERSVLWNCCEKSTIRNGLWELNFDSYKVEGLVDWPLRPSLARRLSGSRRPPIVGVRDAPRQINTQRNFDGCFGCLLAQIVLDAASTSASMFCFAVMLVMWLVATCHHNVRHVFLWDTITNVICDGTRKC